MIAYSVPAISVEANGLQSLDCQGPLGTFSEMSKKCLLLSTLVGENYFNHSNVVLVPISINATQFHSGEHLVAKRMYAILKYV